MARWSNVALSVALIALLLYLFDPRRVAAMLVAADPVLITLAVLANLTANIFGAERFRAALMQLGRTMPRGLAFRVHFAGQFLNQVLPTGMGGDAYRVVAVRPIGGFIRAVRAVLLDRAVGFALLAVMCALAAPFLLVSLPAWPQRMTTLVLAGIAPALVVVIAVARHLPTRRLPRLLRLVLAAVADLQRAFLGRRGLVLVVSAFGFIALSLAAYWLTARAFGSSVPGHLLLLGIPMIFIIKQIPISFAGWGPRELAAVHIFSGLEAGNERSLAISLAFGVIMTLTALPGALMIDIPARRSPAVEGAT